MTVALPSSNAEPWSVTLIEVAVELSVSLNPYSHHSWMQLYEEEFSDTLLHPVVC